MTTPTAPLVTAVVLSWNGAHLLPACLDALRAQSLGPDRLDIWVVDNASTDGTAALVRSAYPEVRLITSDRNRGFAGGMDLALSKVATPYAALVNNDARLEPDALEHLLARLSAPGAERVAAATAKILLAQRFAPTDAAPESAGVEDLVSTADGRLVRPAEDGPLALVNSTGNVVRVDAYGQDRDWLEVDRGQRASGPVFGFCGAAALLRMAAVREVGGFDADFFLYYEDTDLSWRLRLAGWDVHYVAAAVAHHDHAASSREGSAVFCFHDDRNRLLTLTKNASLPLLLRTVPRYPLTALSLARHEAPDLRGTAVRARVLVSYVRLLPRMLVRRVQIGRRASGRRRDVERLLVPVPANPAGGYRRPRTSAPTQSPSSSGQ